MRDGLRAYRVLMALSFRAAPWHATLQLVTGVLMALTLPAAGYGAKLLVDAAVAGDFDRGLFAAGLVALASGVGLVIVFYYVDAVFGVFDRANGLASQRLIRLLGGVDGLAHFERSEYLDQVQLIRERRGDLAQTVNATAGLLRALVTLLATAFLLARVHPVLMLLPLAAALSFWLGKRSKDLQVRAEEVTAAPERLRRHLFEVGTDEAAGKELRVSNLAGPVLARHHTVAEEVLRVRNRASWRGAVLQSLDGLASGVAYAGAIAVVLWLAINGGATPGDVILVIALASQLSMAVVGGVMYATLFLRVLTLARRFVWLVDYARNRARALPANPPALPERLRHGIVLRDVAFGYPETGRPVLDGVSVQLPAGAVVALVGENGAGKTTLVKLLCDLYQPDRGDVLIDGVSLAALPPDAWRSRLSATFQDYANLELTAAEAVGVGDLPRLADRSAVEAAVARAGAEAVVADLPAGLDTQLGSAWPGGVDLSGGQWQRLALARGLMREEPLLVVLDEPTAALDPQTEHALFTRFAAAARAGSRSGTVTLLVSHRFSTVRMADLIVVLEGGRVLESGSHEQLMRTGGRYAELYQLQSRAYR